MNGRSVVSLLAMFTLLGTVFAGCLEAPSFLTASDDEVAARENLDLAQNAAAAWNPDAVLVGVSSFEASEAHAAQAMGMVPADPSVGNGRALLWMYAYQTPDGAQTRIFRVDADGRMQVENTSMVPEGDIPKGLAVQGWAVDSDQALEGARADAKFAEALRADNVSVAIGLASHEGVVKWGVVAVCDEGAVVAVVDATTGAVEMVRDVDYDQFDVGYRMGGAPGVAPAEPVHLEEEGSLDGGESSVEFPFTYEGIGDPAFLKLNAVGRLPGDAVAWAVLDEEGEVVADGRTSPLTTAFRGSMDKAEFDLEQPGDYVLVLTYDPMVPGPLGGVHYAVVLHVGEMDEDADEHSEE